MSNNFTIIQLINKGFILRKGPLFHIREEFLLIYTRKNTKFIDKKIQKSLM